MEDKSKKEKTNDLNQKTQKEKNMVLCPFCGKATSVFWVHGQGQCQFCHSIIDECCMGEGLYFNNSINNNSKKK